jgi:hypothetical protein
MERPRHVDAHRTREAHDKGGQHRHEAPLPPSPLRNFWTASARFTTLKGVTRRASHGQPEAFDPDH